MMNKYEGTHLGMSRRWTHKSGPTSTQWCKRWKNYGEVPRKYIIGLLNKFVGKPYIDFINEYNHKLNSFEGVNTIDGLTYPKQITSYSAKIPRLDGERISKKSILGRYLRKRLDNINISFTVILYTDSKFIYYNWHFISI